MTSDDGRGTVVAERFPAGTFASPSAPASVPRMLASQTRMEFSLFMRNGEQLLVAMIIPAAILVGLSLVKIGSETEPRVDLAMQAVLAIAVMSTGFTGQAIAVGFDRRYGALKRLGATPLPPAVIIGGKTCAVFLIVVVQALVLGCLGLGLGWRPDVAALPLAALVMALGTVTFSALGLLVGGTLKAEIVLALANLVWFLFIGAAGMAVDAGHLPTWLHAGLDAVPSFALAVAIGAALHGTVALGAWIVLALWGAAGAAAAAKLFSFT